MDRSADHEAARADRAQRPHRQRHPGALHAIGADRQGDIRPVVDEEACGVASRRLTELFRQREQIADGQVLLTKLDGLEPGAEAPLDRVLDRARRLRAIRDETERKS